jgi:Uma2 family endonuclease
MVKLEPGEIVLPETKPETEWLRGRAVQKVSPFRPHAKLQAWWIRRLGEWAEDRGEVGSEWRFRIAPPGEVVRPLVPDVSYLSYERMGDRTAEELLAPLVPPTAAIEIMSPGQNRRDLADKVATLIRAGTDLVVVVDPRKRTVTTTDRDATRTFADGDTFTHPALPNFTFAVTEMFAVLELRRPSPPATEPQRDR